MDNNGGLQLPEIRTRKIGPGHYRYGKEGEVQYDLIRNEYGWRWERVGGGESGARVGSKGAAAQGLALHLAARALNLEPIGTIVE